MLSCAECSRKISKYRQLVKRFANVVVSEAAPPGADCPKDNDVDWHEVAAGLWPELKAKHLIMHAALCDHCGPLLRGATSVNDETLARQEETADESKCCRRGLIPFLHQRGLRRDVWQFMRWLVPAACD